MRCTNGFVKREEGKIVIACRRQKFGGLNSCWRKNVRGTSFSSKKGGGKKLLPAAGENLVEYKAAGGKM